MYFNKHCPLFLLLSCAVQKAISTETNNPECEAFGPNILELTTGAVKTCIDSTAYDGKRCFYTYVPDCAGEDAPLVFDIHGFSSCPFFSSAYTGWREKADENCFVLVWPLGNTDPMIADETCFAVPGGLQGIGEDSDFTSTPCCCNGYLPSVPTDDPSFLRETAALIVRDIPMSSSNTISIDTKRIYMAGHSNGCITALSMAILHSDMVAAVGCHSGAALTSFPDTYNPTPMMMIHGTADQDVNYNGTEWYLSTLSQHNLLATKNKCTSNKQLLNLNESPVNNYTEYTASSCENNATIVLLALDNVGHFPFPNLEGKGIPIEEGTDVTVIDTTQLAWDFMNKFSLDVPPVLEVSSEDEPVGDNTSSTSFSKDVSLLIRVLTSVMVASFSWA